MHDYSDPHAQRNSYADRALEAGLKLAAEGTPVFPCNWHSKAPTKPESRGGQGYKDATADIGALRALWRDSPGGLLGVPCGAYREFVLPDLLDLDFAKHPEAKDWWVANRRGIPRTRIYRSRSDGLHLLFRHDPRAKNNNSGRIVIGVDTKTTGGYRIDWPSAGCLVLCEGPIAAWPEWLLRAQQPPPLRPRPVYAATTGNITGLARFAASVHGGNRNAGLHWAGCRAWEAGGAENDLRALVEAAMQNGLSRSEAERVVFKQARKTVKGI